ncbi:hypothetical protein Acsp03_10030 [Actinomadura sp. NBRC 104412]|nr:hypothetical protein Acsp03_10030 [Actinomadura sp. NBRC 104412]
MAGNARGAPRIGVRGAPRCGLKKADRNGPIGPGRGGWGGQKDSTARRASGSRTPQVMSSSVSSVGDLS